MLRKFVGSSPRRRRERRESILRYATVVTLAVAVLAPAARIGLAHSVSAAGARATCRVADAGRPGGLPVSCLSSILAPRVKAASSGATAGARTAPAPNTVDTTPIITTFAGGLSGGGAPVDYAMIPQGVALFGAGRLLITDSGNYLVWLANLTPSPTRLYGKTVAAGRMVPVAGNASAGFSGDGGPATKAQLRSPYGVATDLAGNLYIADSNNERIREVMARTGIITTVAGTGSAGYSGDGGAATQAMLNFPVGLALDGHGNLYIADTNNSRVREVIASTGVITTVAGNGIYGYLGDGNPATQAELSDPQGVALDGAGDIYITDQNNQRIREVQAPSGIIKTLAGTGQYGFSGDGGPAYLARLADPTGIATDPAGNVFFTDRSNERVREVITGTEIITTVIGDGYAGFFGDGGPATEARLNFPQGVAVDSSDNIYVADNENERVREATSSNGIINTVAGTGTCCNFSGDGGPAAGAVLNMPQGMVTDHAGDVFFADTANNRIREVLARTGIITTVAGDGSCCFSGDGGPATRAALNRPDDVAVDGSGNIFIADTNNQRIREVIAGTGVITTIAGSGFAGFSGDGGPATKATINTPTGVAVDSSGDLFIADERNNRIRVVYLRVGVIKTFAGNGVPGFSGDGGPATSAELKVPSGVAVDRMGNLYIADTANYRVRRVLASNGIISTVAGGGTGCTAQTDSVGDGCKGTQAVLDLPTGVAADSSANIFIGDSQYERVREVITGTQIITTVAGNGTAGFSGDGGPATQAQLNDPTGVAADNTGHVYVADTNNNRIRVVRYR